MEYAREKISRKMTGDREIVAREKSAFVAFLKSFEFANRPSPTTMAATPPHTGDRPQWNVPADWREVPGGQFLIAKFAVETAADTPAAVNVSSSAGDGGGVVANVNRWRRQLGLAAGSAAEIESAAQALTTTAGPATLVLLVRHPLPVVATLRWLLGRALLVRRFLERLPALRLLLVVLTAVDARQGAEQPSAEQDHLK